MFSVHYHRRLLAPLLLGSVLATIANTEFSRPEHRGVVVYQAAGGLIPWSLEYYRSKIHKFLKLLYGYSVRRIVVEQMSPDDTTFGPDCPAYATGNIIRINIKMLERYSDADKFFIIAHEVAHHFLGHTKPSARHAHRQPQELEEEADITAARMLCANGLRWVVEEYSRLLHKDILKGNGDESDGIHPTSKEKYAYLQPILAQDFDTMPVVAADASVFKRSTSAMCSLVDYLKDTLAHPKKLLS